MQNMIVCFIFGIELDFFGAEAMSIAGICHIFSHFITFSQQAYMILFYTIVYGIRENYKRINSILEVEILQKIDKNQKSSYIKVLKSLSNLHLDVYHINQLSNQIFSIPIMFVFGYNILASVFSLYEILSVISTPNVNFEQIGICMVVNAWLPSAIVASVLTIFACMLAVVEGYDAINILSNILSKEADKKLRNKLRLIILQIQHSRPNFSCGLFVFDWEYLGMVKC